MPHDMEPLNPEETAPESEMASAAPANITAEEWEAAQNELKDYKDKYLRLLADMENLRKRMVKERNDHAHHTVASVVCDFLPPLDNLENALNYAHQMSDEVRNWALGFQMVLSQFKDVLAAHGVTPMTATGEAFDPHQHEAVEAVESETHAPGTVIEEYVKGYKMGPKTIRPARVKVAKQPTSKGELPDGDADAEEPKIIL